METRPVNVDRLRGTSEFKYLQVQKHPYCNPVGKAISGVCNIEQVLCFHKGSPNAVPDSGLRILTR